MKKELNKWQYGIKTIKEEIHAKTLKGLKRKIYKYLDHCRKDTKTEMEQAEICSNGKNVK